MYTKQGKGQQLPQPPPLCLLPRRTPTTPSPSLPITAMPPTHRPYAHLITLIPAWLPRQMLECGVAYDSWALKAKLHSHSIITLLLGDKKAPCNHLEMCKAESAASTMVLASHARLSGSGASNTVPMRISRWSGTLAGPCLAAFL